MAKITKVEMKTASNDNPYKQVTVDTGIGDKDRFNIFNDHSKYDKCVDGAEIPQDLLFINQRGYLELKDTTKGASKTEVTEMAIKTHITQVAQALELRLERIEQHLGTKPPETIGNTNVAYPDSQTSNGDGSTPVEELNPEDVPF